MRMVQLYGEAANLPLRRVIAALESPAPLEDAAAVPAAPVPPLVRTGAPPRAPRARVPRLARTRARLPVFGGR